jgi:hypothetical protein
LPAELFDRILVDRLHFDARSVKSPVANAFQLDELFFCLSIACSRFSAERTTIERWQHLKSRSFRGISLKKQTR